MLDKQPTSTPSDRAGMGVVRAALLQGGVDAAPGDEANRLRTLAAGISEGRFVPTVAPHRGLCADCPGRPALCSWDESHTLADTPPHALEGTDAHAPGSV